MTFLRATGNQTVVFAKETRVIFLKHRSKSLGDLKKAFFANDNIYNHTPQPYKPRKTN